MTTVIKDIMLVKDTTVINDKERNYVMFHSYSTQVITELEALSEIIRIQYNTLSGSRLQGYVYSVINLETLNIKSGLRRSCFL